MRLFILIAILIVGALLTGAKPPSPPVPWFTAGNSGTNVATNTLGTTDNQPRIIKTNSIERMRIDTAGNVDISGHIKENGSDLLSNDINGNATTATALAIDGVNCLPGSSARGVDASGNVQGCTADADTTYTAGPELSLSGNPTLAG